jgi:hypothetical protein
MSAQTLLFA